MKIGICNELFRNLTFPESCKMVAKHGFDGLEIAPFTVCRDPIELQPEGLRSLKNHMNDNGLECAGLHWLLNVPEGLQLVTRDETLRRRSWKTMDALVTMCGELGGKAMVLGSGRQRSNPDVPLDEAVELLTAGLGGLVPMAEDAGVKILLEALPSKLKTIINTIEEARRVIEEVDSPAVRGMFDFHNCDDESVGWKELIRRHIDIIEHVHLNDPDGGYPSVADGGGVDDRYVEAFRALNESGYTGWVSLEIFHFDSPPEIVLRETRRFIDEVMSKL